MTWDAMTGAGTEPGRPDVADGAPRPALPAVLAARWAQAQGQLFGVLSMQPELYEQVVLVLAGTLDRLRERTATTADLLAVADSVPEIVLEVARAQGLATDGFDAVQVAMAALAGRLPEVRVQEANRHRASALAAARSGRGGWVVLEESGDPAGNPVSPYRRLEADPQTGAALLVRTEPDELFTGCVHLVVALRVDLDTGALLPAEDSRRAPDRPSPADRREREELVARLRQG